MLKYNINGITRIPVKKSLLYIKETWSNFLPCCRWVRASNEFLDVLLSSKYMHVQKKVNNILLYLHILLIGNVYSSSGSVLSVM